MRKQKHLRFLIRNAGTENALQDLQEISADPGDDPVADPSGQIRPRYDRPGIKQILFYETGLFCLRNNDARNLFRQITFSYATEPAFPSPVIIIGQIRGRCRNDSMQFFPFMRICKLPFRQPVRHPNTGIVTHCNASFCLSSNTGTEAVPFSL